MKKTLGIIVALVLSISVLIGLTSTIRGTAKRGGPMLAAANRQKILLVTVGSEPKTLDPGLTDTDPEGKIEEALFEGLVITDPKDGSKQIPGAAEAWEHNSDYSVWTFHLRTNGKWSNGDPSVTGWYPNVVDDHPYKFVDLKSPEELSDLKLLREPE